MMTLITGGTGAGKTAWVLNQLLDWLALEEQAKIKDPDYVYRPVFVHGVRELLIPHTPVYCTSELCDLCRKSGIDALINDVDSYSPDVTYSEGVKVETYTVSQQLKIDKLNGLLFVDNWFKWSPPGALIIIDEVQRIWRPRAASSATPPAVSYLETHRHSGIDFWLISQGPHLFDNFIRLLVTRHVHLLSHWMGRKQYEWPECRTNVQSRADAVSYSYTLPKRVYTLYKSAEVHTKQMHRKPRAFYILCALLFMLPIAGYMSYVRIMNRVNPSPVSSDDISVGGGVGGSVSGSGAVGAVSSIDSKTGLPDFTPKTLGVLESAPAYKALLKVVAVPLLSGCIQSKTDCKCYTSQATIYPSTPELCMSIIKGARFNPYLALRKDVPVEKSLPVVKPSPVVYAPAPYDADSSLVHNRDYPGHDPLPLSQQIN